MMKESAANILDSQTQKIDVDAEVFPSSYAISGRALGYRYGGQWAVRGLDLQVPRGAIYGFLGLNGAGKSTTMRMMMGLLPVHEGSLMVAGADPMQDDLDVKRRVGYVPDTPAFYDWMTVEETCALLAHYRPDRWSIKRQQSLLQDLSLDPSAQTRSLSKGQRARLSLVLALGFDPEILVLDEPTLGLDPVARKQFTEGILREYAGEGKTVFISSHLIHEIAGIVDYVGILKDGRMVSQSTAEDLRNRFRRVELFFENEAPISLPPEFAHGRYTRSGREGILVLNDATKFNEVELASLEAESSTISEMTLEEIFIEVTGAADREVGHE